MWRRRRRRVSRHDGVQQLTTTVVQRANDICSTRTETPAGVLSASSCIYRAPNGRLIFVRLPDPEAIARQTDGDTSCWRLSGGP